MAKARAIILGLGIGLGFFCLKKSGLFFDSVRVASNLKVFEILAFRQQGKPRVLGPDTG